MLINSLKGINRYYLFKRLIDKTLKLCYTIFKIIPLQRIISRVMGYKREYRFPNVKDNLLSYLILF